LGLIIGIDTLIEMVKLQTNGKDANSIFYSGISYLPLGIGQKFTIINNTVEHNLVVIEATHHSEVHGNYTCAFKAIPSDVGAPHYTNVHAYAKAESQPAKVIDNNDPDGLGRVKVAFNWAGGNTKSDWMRLIQPHAGAGKGFYFIPEIDEEVLVGFEGGSAERPYIMGANYNGSESSGYNTSGNDQKVIHTRSGTKMIFNDAEGSVFIEDPSGNTWKMDGQGNISVNSPKNFTVNAGENVSITAGKNVTVSAGENIYNSANKDITQTAGHDISQTAAGDFTESANNKTEVIEQKYIRGSMESTQHADKVTILSAKENMLLESSQKTVEVNSAEKSSMF
jgi:type VI secretion system secreted protein VgrG